MTRKTIIKDDVYRTYFLHQKYDGLVKEYLDKLIDLTEKSFTKGDWICCHLRYQLADGVSNQEFIEELKRIYPRGKSGSSMQDAIRIVWVRELGKKKQSSDNGITAGVELESRPDPKDPAKSIKLAHYHAAIFINTDVRAKSLPHYLNKMVDLDHVIPKSEYKAKRGRKRLPENEKEYLQYFYLANVQPNYTSPELWNYVDLRELDQHKSIDGYKLHLNCIDSVYYAVAWLCYLSKVETKFKDDKLSRMFENTRAFGSSQVSANWRDSEKHWTVKAKIKSLDEHKLLKSEKVLENALDESRPYPPREFQVAKSQKVFTKRLKKSGGKGFGIELPPFKPVSFTPELLDSEGKDWFAFWNETRTDSHTDTLPF